jgi:hypothetical protein
MKRAGIAATLVAAIVVTGGCATIMKGKNQTVSITSNVDAAEIFLDGQRIGVTPFVGLVPKNKSMLMVQKTGYQAANVALSKTLEPAFWGNIIIGGTLGSLTDFATGAAYQYAPASYQVELRAASQSVEEFRKQVELRGFAMIYIDEISRDLGRGTGDHLSALLSLLNAEQPGTVGATAVRDALTASQGDQVGFGQRIVALK